MGVTAVAVVVGIGSTAAVGAEIVAAVALTATVVGIVTKSPVLTKIGAGLGLAAAGANLIAGSSDSLAESGASAAAADSAGTAAAAAPAATTAASAAAPAIETVNVTAPALSGASAAGNVVAGTASLAAQANNLASRPTQENLPSANPADINLQAPTIQAPSAPTLPEIRNPASWFDDALTGIENHKALATSSAQLIGGALSGMGTTYAADKQYDINKQLLELQKKKAANASAQPTINPQYNGTANLYPTTTPVYSGTQTAGIINQQRKPA